MLLVGNRRIRCINDALALKIKWFPIVLLPFDALLHLGLRFLIHRRLFESLANVGQVGGRNDGFQHHTENGKIDHLMCQATYVSI